MQSRNPKLRTPRRLAAGAALLCAGLALSLPSPARAGHGHGHHDGGDSASFALRHAEEIGVDAATRGEIEQIVAAAREQAEALHEEKRQAREQLRKLLDQDEPDQGAVLRQAEAIGAIDLRQQQHHLRTLLAVRAKLTPEQRAALEARKQELRKESGMGNHSECGHGRCEGGCEGHATCEGGCEGHATCEGGCDHAACEGHGAPPDAAGSEPVAGSEAAAGSQPAAGSL